MIYITNFFHLLGFELITTHFLRWPLPLDQVNHATSPFCIGDFEVDSAFTPGWSGPSILLISDT
jgi:hypothetical protein